MERWKEAEADASRSIEMGNDSSRKHDRRGQARYNLGNYEGALEDFSRAKALDPNTKSVDQNIEYCKQNLKRIQSEKEKKERNPEKVKDEIPTEILPATDEGERAEKAQSVNEHHSSSSDSDDETSRNISVQNNNVNDNTEADDSKTNVRKTDNVNISPPDLRQSKNEKTDEELRLEIEADKEELERRLQAELDQKAKEGMIELIREKILEEEKLKLMQEKLALRDMVERYKDEEKRKNCEIQDQGTDPDSGIGSSSDYCEVLMILSVLVFLLHDCDLVCLATDDVLQLISHLQEAKQRWQ